MHVRMYIAQKKKEFNLLLPTGHFMMQSLLLLSNDDDRLIKKEKERDNLTPRHLHV